MGSFDCLMAVVELGDYAVDKWQRMRSTDWLIKTRIDPRN